MKRLLAALFCSSLGWLPALAQTTPPAKPAPGPAGVARWNGHLSPEPQQFMLDVQAMMTSVGTPNAKAGVERLGQLWGSNTLTAGQQRSIAELAEQMLGKKMKPVPHLTTFFAAVVGAKTKANLSEAQLDQYLGVVKQSVEKDSPADLDKYLVSTAQLLGSGNTLYRSGYNSLRFSGGQLAFSYKAAPVVDPNLSFDSPPAPVPTPAKTAPKPAPKPAAKKPAAKKKRASDGWDTADMWSKPAAKNDGWGDDGWNTAAPKKTAAKPAAKSDGWDDGWGAPAPKKKTPAKSVAKKAAPKPAPKPAQPATPTLSKSDFDDVPFAPSEAAAFAAYNPPQQTGALIELKDAELVLGTPGDSLVIHKVSGTLSTATNRLVATGGQVAWTIKGNPVTADLKGFDFDVTKPEFTAQPVTLTYPFLLEAPVQGALSCKSQRRKAGADDNGYPRFISLTNDVRVKNLGPGITYVGGLSMAGSRVLSAALDGSASHLAVTQEGKVRFRATSTSYILADSSITATRAAVALYQNTGDSITHPGVEMKYLKGKQQLKLLYEKGTFRTTPYSDSYHQVDIRAQMLVWNLREPKMDFSIITSPTQVAADFESKSFFSNTRYQRLKSINQLHPLQLLLGYSIEHGHGSVLNVRDVAEASHIKESDLRSTVTGLARDGYVEVRPATGEVVLLPKARLYVGAARGKRDYDNIDIKSLTGSGRSATLNLNSNQLVLHGVKQFNFTDDSAAVAVIVQPDSGTVRLQKNRNMSFGGRVKTSQYSFKGHDYQFDYNGYYIEMPHIDSLTLRTKNKKKDSKTASKESRPSDFQLTSKGTTQSGRLYLNDPLNRSGRKKMAKYPSFSSTSGSAIYFGKPDVLGGAYDSTTYFDVPPFKLDSMGGSKAQASFVGVFHSKALPPIKTALTSQADGTMGFVHTVPPEGYALYGKKGKLSGGAKVQLNGGGLQSNGTVTYQGATLQSDKFVLYGDSLTGVGKTGAIAAGTNTPKVVLPPGYLINWVASTDSLHLQSPADGTAIKMYADHTFKGSLLLTPTKLGGEGRLDGPQSYVRSDDLTFKNDSYSGRKGLMSVKSAQAGKAALTAPDVDFTYDLKNGNATFKRDRASTARIELPYSGFQTSLGAGSWDFKKKRVELRASGADSAHAVFASTVAEQNGLKFQAAAATYDLTKYQLVAKGVPHIAVADAWVVPDSGRVVVAGGGKLRELHRAKLLLDSLSRFHKLIDGNITVTSRTSFGGDAKYMTLSPKGDSVALKFNNFKADSASILAPASRGLFRRKAVEAPTGLATVATAVTEHAEKFQLAPHIVFEGGIGLSSKRRGLISDGRAQLQFGKKPGPPTAAWFAVRDSIDPKKVYLDLRHIKSDDDVPLQVGLFVSDADNKLYPLYGGPKQGDADVPFFNAAGTLHYNSAAGDYIISSQDNPTEATKNEGTTLTYHEGPQTLDFQGPLNFINNSKSYHIAAAGVGRANPDSARYQVQALLGIDAVMPGKATDVLASTFAAATKNAPEGLTGTPEQLANIGQVGGTPAATAFGNRRGGMAAPALASLSPKLQHTLTLGNVNLRWNAVHKAWYSVGKIAVSGVGKQGLNALLDGYVEIKHENSTDVVEVYLEADAATWVYFRYANNVLITKSSSDTYDGEISNKQKGAAETATAYGVFLGEYEDADRFRSNFQKLYLGKSGKLAPRPAAPAPAVEVETRKKKKGKEAATTDEPGTEPAPEPSKKKKKAKDNDPFGDGVIDAPPTEEPVKQTKKEAKAAAKEAAKEPAIVPAPVAAPVTRPAPAVPATTPAPVAVPTTTPAPVAAPVTTPTPVTTPVTEPAVAPVTAPATEPAATDEPVKETKKEKAKEAEPDPNAEPGTEPDKKSKKKKKTEDDPFGN
ncbi:MAG: hypothetical protein ACRYFX_20360 [Janthinobacterium lividum]